MKISVVICTRDRHEMIGSAIESVAACVYPSFDIHIMDQSTNDLTRCIVEKLADQHRAGCAIHYHHLDEAGLSRAYNLGMKSSDGEIIALTDDDCIVPPNWLARIASAFREDLKAGLLYGQVLVPKHLEADVEQGLIIPSLTFDQPARIVQGRPFLVFGMGANMAVRRTLLERVRGFDVALGGGGPLRSAQDYDFAYRTYLADMAILLCPEVTVDHYGVRTPAQWPLTLEAYGIGDGAFLGKHIRCGDLRALRFLCERIARSRVREVREALRLRRWVADIYGRNLLVGIRSGAKFDVDRQRRLYRENSRTGMTVTQANSVTAVGELNHAE